MLTYQNPRKLKEGDFKPTFRNKIGTSKCGDMVVSYLCILIYNSLYLSEETNTTGNAHAILKNNKA